MLENYTSNQHQQQTNHYYNDSHKRGGKRQPCPQCKSLTQYHENNHGKLKCYACGYVPSKAVDSTFTAMPKISQPLCDCGNPLKSPSQIKLNKCYFCQVNMAHAIGNGGASPLGSFAYSLRKGLSGLILAMLGARLINLHGEIFMAYPLINGAGQIGYQVIDQRGGKFFAYPKHDKADFHTFIGNREGDLIACEGLATGISIFMAMPNVNILVCGNADNLIKMANLYGERIKVIGADNDKKHVGLIKAESTAKLCGARVWLCPVASDFNDLHMAKGLQAIADSFMADSLVQSDLRLQAKKLGMAYRQVNMASLEGLELPDKGIHILISGMGTGKTKHVLKEARDRAESSIAIANLKTLVNGLASGLNSVSYETTDTIKPHMAVCVNSTAKYESSFKTVMIDEFDGCLDTLAMGENMTDFARRKADMALNRMVNGADNVILASATDLTEHLAKIKSMAGDKPITITENVYRKPKKLVLITIAEYVIMCSQGLKQGKNVFDIFDSKNKVIALENEAKQNGVTVLSVHSDNSPTNMQAIINGDYVNYQYVIGSPSIMQGVSFEQPHFDLVFVHMDGGADLSPLTACQALGRVRTVDTVYVVLGNRKDRIGAYSYDTPGQILAKKRASYLHEVRRLGQENGLSESEIQAQINLITNVRLTDYDHHAVAIKKAHGDLAIHWNDNFLGFAQNLGYEIVDNRQINMEADRLARQDMAVKVGAVKAERYTEIANTDLLTYNIESLRYKMDKTEAEEYAIIKADCEQIFESSTVETVKNVLENDLHGKAFNHALAQCPEYASAKFNDDMAAILAGDKSTANTKNVSAKYELLTELLALIGVTIDGAGNCDFSQAKQFMANDDFTAIDDLIKRNKFSLGFSRYTVEGHKTILRLLRGWFGFEIEAKRAHGGAYIWRVVGLKDSLTAIGGRNKLKGLHEALAKLGGAGVTFGVNDKTHGIDTPKVTAWDMTNGAGVTFGVNDKMHGIDTPKVTAWDMTNGAGVTFGVNDKMHGIDTPKVTACAHERIFMAGDYPTCQHCGAQWANIDFYFMDLQAKEAGAWAV